MRTRSGGRWAKVRRVGRTARRSLVLLGVLVAASVPAATATGAVVWQMQYAAPVPPYTEFYGPAFFSGVSCPSVNYCMAVGDLHEAVSESWNGLTWSAHHLADRLGDQVTDFRGVSCASNSMCIAVGYASEIGSNVPVRSALWNGTTWSAGTEPGVATSVSCPSVTACVAVGAGGAGGGYAASWDGKTWSVAPVPLPAGAVLQSFGPVSCSSAVACTAIGTYVAQGQPPSPLLYPLVERWDGQSWSPQAAANAPGGPFWPQSISCVSNTDCIAVGGWQQPNPGDTEPTTYPYAEEWSGASWTPETLGLPLTGSITTVSCWAVAACVAGGSQPMAWDGTTWSPEPSVGITGSPFGAVSCASSTVCMAVGGDGNIPTAASTVPPGPGHAVLTGVSRSCVRHRSTAEVTGVAITSVRWSLDRRAVRGQALQNGQQYAARVTPLPGRHTLGVTVTFAPATVTPSLTISRTVIGCRHRSRRPRSLARL